MSQPYLSIIIPAYNEEPNFKKGSLNKVVDYLNEQSYTWEVLIVDDGSSDSSPDLLEKFCKQHKGFRLIRNTHMGKAGTVAKGVEEASGKYILFTDFDQSTPLSDWEKLHSYLKSGYKVVIGSREVVGSRRDEEPLYRHIMGRGFNWGVQLIAVSGIRDTQCGFKTFEGKAAKKLFSKLQVYKPRPIANAFTGAFDVEVLFLARKLGYRIAEVPINWAHVETTRVSAVRDSIRMAWDVLKIRMYDLAGKYKDSR